MTQKVFPRTPGFNLLNYNSVIVAENYKIPIFVFFKLIITRTKPSAIVHNKSLQIHTIKSLGNICSSILDELLNRLRWILLFFCANIKNSFRSCIIISEIAKSYNNLNRKLLERLDLFWFKSLKNYKSEHFICESHALTTKNSSLWETGWQIDQGNHLAHVR